MPAIFTTARGGKESVRATAAICTEFGAPLTLTGICVAEPASGEVLVEIAACAICHSDIMFINGGWGGALPAVYGHEASGIVREVGSQVKSVVPGDHVVVTLIRACGACPDCRDGHPVRCHKGQTADTNAVPLTLPDGTVVTQGMATGAFAELVLIHDSQICKIPQDFPLDLASLLACGVVTGLGAVFNTARVRAGSHVAVIGAGGVGLNSVQGAALAGARTVTAFDICDEKLVQAKNFGATHAISAVADDISGQVQDITGGHGFDYVFVTVGAKAVMDAAFDHLAFGGTVVIVGMPASGVMSEYDPGLFAYKSQRILGSRMGGALISRDIPLLIELYRQGRLKLDELITGRFQFDQINRAIAASKAGDALRNVILFPGFSQKDRGK